MTTAYTSLLGLALPVTGELSGTWGDTVNTAITSLLDTAIAGTTSITTDADVTLTTTTGAANTSRQAILLCSGARTVLRTITAPAQSKIYTVINATTGGFSVKIVGVGPTTGVTIVAGESAVVAWNGSDFIKISNTGGSASFTNVTVTGTTTLSGLTASTALALNASKEVVSVTNTGTGNNVLSASPTLTGTVGGASLTLSSLTSGRVTYAGTSGLLQDSANLTFNGTTLTANTLNLTNALGTAYGGTGLTSFTSGGVVYASSSSALATGSALTFDGTNTVTLNASAAVVNLGITTNYGVVTAAGTNPAAIYFNGATRTSFQSHLQYFGANHTFFNETGGSEIMRLLNTGNVGIGTSSPSVKLMVENSIATAYSSTNTLSASPIAYLYNPNAGASVAATLRLDAGTDSGNSATTISAIRTGAGSSALTFGTRNGGADVAEGMRLDALGNFGLGVTSVLGRAQFNVSDTSTTVLNSTVLYLSNTGASTTNQRIDLAFRWQDGTYNGNTAISAIRESGTSRLTSIAFCPANSSGDPVEQVRINSSGKLCIGRTTTINGAMLAIECAGSSTAIGTTWADDTYMIQQRFNSEYFMGVGGDAAGRNLKLVANSADATAKITFWTSGNGTPIERARFSAAGDLELYVTPAKDSKLQWTSAGGGAPLAFLIANGNPELIGQCGGSGGVKLTSGATSWVSNSDIRNKNIIEPISNGLEKIATLSSVIYSFKDDEKQTRRVGLIAQEVLAVLPEAVYVPKKEEELLGVRYSEVIPLLVAAIKEQQATIESLKARLDAANL